MPMHTTRYASFTHARRHLAKMKKTKLHEYEITLQYIGKKKPSYIDTEYGFGINPPIVIHAKNEKEAVSQLRLPKTVKIAEIVKIE